MVKRAQPNRRRAHAGEPNPKATTMPFHFIPKTLVLTDGKPKEGG